VLLPSVISAFASLSYERASVRMGVSEVDVVKEEVNKVRPRKGHGLLILVHVSLALLLWTAFAAPVTWAAGPLVNGGLDRYLPVYENGRPLAWQGYPERIGIGWQATELLVGGDLHLMDSYTLALFRARVLGEPLSNIFYDGYLSQGMASQTPFDLVVFQAVSVQRNQAYAFTANVATYWRGVGAERDDSQVFKRVGIDPVGGSSPNAPNIIWSEWESLDKQWVSLRTTAVAQSQQMTVFVQVQTRGGAVSGEEITLGYIDGVSLEPISTPVTPTATPSPTSPPLPTPTLMPTWTPVVLPSPTPTPMPSPTATLAPWPTLTAVPWPTPTSFPTPGPTPSPSPTGAAMPYFKLKTVRMLSISENGGCLGNHHVFLSVLDAGGNPMLGTVIGDPPANNFRVTSGEKYEPFFNWGTKLAEISLFNSGTRLRVIESPAGKLALSDQAPLLSTNTWEIPVSWLVEAGYCRDESECGGLLCQGHYSYWVVFQQVSY
jgi:hypothetical protein